MVLSCNHSPSCDMAGHSQALQAPDHLTWGGLTLDIVISAENFFFCCENFRREERENPDGRAQTPSEPHVSLLLPPWSRRLVPVFSARRGCGVGRTLVHLRPLDGSPRASRAARPQATRQPGGACTWQRLDWSRQPFVEPDTLSLPGHA